MKKLLAILFILNMTAMFGQQVGINTNTPNSSAVLDIVSSTQGILFPRMNSTARLAISDPAVGLQVVDTTLNAVFVYSPNGWQQSNSIWKLNGDKVYYNKGAVGVGTNDPQSNLHIVDSLPSFKMTNDDGNGLNSSIIIELDESEDDIIFSGEVGYDKRKLFSVKQNGDFGIGSHDPIATLHVEDSLPNFKMTNNEGNGPNTSIIIELDESEDDIIFSGEIGNVKTRLFSSTQTGNFGIGDMSPDTTLHIKDMSPFIQYTNGNNEAFLVGLDNVDNSYKIKTPNLTYDLMNMSSAGLIGFNASDYIRFNPGIESKVAKFYELTAENYYEMKAFANGDLRLSSYDTADLLIQDDLLKVTEEGDLSFSSNASINISPGIITPEIELYNPATSDTVSLAVDSSGALNFSNTSLADRDFFKTYSISGTSFSSSAVDSLNYFSSISQLAHVAANYSLATNNRGIIVASDGYYNIDYTLVFKQNNPSSDNPTVKVEISVNGQVVQANYFGVWSNQSDTKTLNANVYLSENDEIRIKVSIPSYSNSNHNTNFVSDGSKVDIVKISN